MEATQAVWYYTYTVGEKGNNVGHVSRHTYQTEAGARNAMRSEIAEYGEGMAWGHINARHENGEWERLTNDNE